MSQLPLDLDNDGRVSDIEIKMFKQKIQSQSRMAWTCLIIIISVNIFLFFFASEQRILALSAIYDMLMLTLGGMVAAHMGAVAFISSRTKTNSNYINEYGKE